MIFSHKVSSKGYIFHVCLPFVQFHNNPQYYLIRDDPWTVDPDRHPRPHYPSRAEVGVVLVDKEQLRFLYVSSGKNDNTLIDASIGIAPTNTKMIKINSTYGVVHKWRHILRGWGQSFCDDITMAYSMVACDDGRGRGGEMLSNITGPHLWTTPKPWPEFVGLFHKKLFCQWFKDC